MTLSWIIPVLMGAAIIIPGLSVMLYHAGYESGSDSSLGGLVRVPPCTWGLNGTFELQFGFLDDEGFSEYWGDLRRSGWENVPAPFDWSDKRPVRGECRKGVPA